MPELPEVETIARGLRRALPGRAVVRARVLRDNVVRGSSRRFARAVTGARIESVERRGKFLVLRLADGRVWLSHLRMSGKWLLERPRRAVRDRAEAGRRPPARATRRGERRAPAGAAPRGEPRGPLPAYTRAVFDLDDGARLLYVDPRTLGEMEIVPAGEWKARAEDLGLEPLGPAFTPEALTELLDASRRTVKEFLLDQTRIAGLGNIYASEALWRAGVSPRRRACNVGAARARRLHRAIVEVLGQAIGRSGTSFGSTYLDFIGADGEAGGFYDFLNVYDREGLPCPRCRGPIERIVQGQRSTYFCPRCQR